MSNVIWIRKLFNAVLLLGTKLVLMWSLREKNFFAEQFLQFINLALGFRRQCYTSAKHSLLSRNHSLWIQFIEVADKYILWKPILFSISWYFSAIHVHVLNIVWRWRNLIAAVSKISQNELSLIFWIHIFYTKLV